MRFAFRAGAGYDHCRTIDCRFNAFTLYAVCIQRRSSYDEICESVQSKGLYAFYDG